MPMKNKYMIREVKMLIKSLEYVSILLLVLIFTTGCVNKATATPYPAAEVDKINSVYVLKHDKDTNSVNKIIANKFETMGYKVDTGQDSNFEADILITYIDKWMWDITMYMIELTVIIRDPKTEFPLAKGNSMHTSLTRKSPEGMVDEVIGNIFKYKKGI